MPFGIMAFPDKRKKRDRFEATELPDFGPDPEYPESQALEALRQHYGAQPQRSDFQHSAMDKIAAALVGAATGLGQGAGAGVQAGRGLMDRSYIQAMQDFSQRGQGLEDLAKVEGMEGERSFRTAQEGRRGREAQFDRSMSMRRHELDESAEDRLVAAMESAQEDRRIAQEDRDLDREERGLDRAERERYHRTVEDRLAKERQQKLGPEKVLTPRSQQEAEDYALDRVLRDYPEFEKFTTKDEEGFPTISKDIGKGGLLGIFGGRRERSPEEQQEFDRFLDMLEEERDNILNNQADPYSKLRGPKPGVGAPLQMDYREVFGGR